MIDMQLYCSWQKIHTVLFAWYRAYGMYVNKLSLIIRARNHSEIAFIKSVKTQLEL